MSDDASRKREKSEEMKMVRGLSRRDFIKYSGGAVACLYLGTLTAGCSSSGSSQITSYPIDSTVVTTTERVLSFPYTKVANPDTALLSQVDNYSSHTPPYGEWTFSDEGLQIVPRFDLMPTAFPATAASLVRIRQFANFFSISDIHITDKEAPNQMIYFQQKDPTYCGVNTSIYSPVITCTTHVLDAAIQTVNALHKRKPFTFGISLGDTCNNTSYNELRWYLDVIDGKVITPSSGAHLGADTIDYQRPYQAAGLDKSIPWYQAMGNHDHFYIGSVPVYTGFSPKVQNPIFDLVTPYTSDTVWAIGDLLIPNLRPLGEGGTFPALFDLENIKGAPQYYAGVLDGLSPTGAIINAGTSTPPKVAADPNRRPLVRTEWIQEFFTTTTLPKGHGFPDSSKQDGFACYSFLPDPKVPLKIIVLDDTQSEADGSHDIHGHGFLDAQRWQWLQAELQAGDKANQLMIIAAHVPIAVNSIGSEMEWWESDKDPNATLQNTVNLFDLINTIQNTTSNLIMWMAGHRHFNTVKALKPIKGEFKPSTTPSPVTDNPPESGFWQVETSSLRDHPQQFRTFEVLLNSDYSVSIVTVNVDPAVAPGTPAAKSRSYSIAAQQIIQTNLQENNPNLTESVAPYPVTPVETMDPTRAQDKTTDPTIIYGSVYGVPYCASYNAELYKQLSPAMVTALKKKYPLPTA